jgi:hypothetical protein
MTPSFYLDVTNRAPFPRRFLFSASQIVTSGVGGPEHTLVSRRADRDRCDVSDSERLRWRDASERLEVRAFWSRHVAAWKRFNQREYCERHCISRPLLQRWRIWLSEDCARGAHQDRPMPPPAAAFWVKGVSRRPGTVRRLPVGDRDRRRCHSDTKYCSRSRGIEADPAAPRAERRHGDCLEGRQARARRGRCRSGGGVREELIRWATRSAWDADDNAAEGEARAPMLLGRHG